MTKPHPPHASLSRATNVSFYVFFSQTFDAGGGGSGFVLRVPLPTDMRIPPPSLSLGGHSRAENAPWCGGGARCQSFVPYHPSAPTLSMLKDAVLAHEGQNLPYMSTRREGSICETTHIGCRRARMHGARAVEHAGDEGTRDRGIGPTGERECQSELAARTCCRSVSKARKRCEAVRAARPCLRGLAVSQLKAERHRRPASAKMAGTVWRSPLRFAGQEPPCFKTWRVG